LTRSDGSAIIRASDLENDQAYTAQRCLPANDCYTVTVTDSVGDGICCGYGQGSFEVNVDGQRVGGGGEFGSEASVSFGQCAPAPSPTPAPPSAGTCGGGSTGNGACANGQCCSQWGWCGTSADHCSGQPPSPTPAPPTPAPPSAGTCGGGSTGNGACANGQCCSQWGWCGTSADHCG
jgi:hypothetical protein